MKERGRRGVCVGGGGVGGGGGGGGGGARTPSTPFLESSPD